MFFARKDPRDIRPGGHHCMLYTNLLIEMIENIVRNKVDSFRCLKCLLPVDIPYLFIVIEANYL